MTTEAIITLVFVAMTFVVNLFNAFINLINIKKK
ncbi:hypothetical protein SAMN05428987_3139 [Paenibacillus sp. CF095]|nr:hypothetical protein SAMN05428987_3139 [Paenibacillus sp. CF095]